MLRNKKRKARTLFFFFFFFQSCSSKKAPSELHPAGKSRGISHISELGGCSQLRAGICPRFPTSTRSFVGRTWENPHGRAGEHQAEPSPAGSRLELAGSALLRGWRCQSCGCSRRQQHRLSRKPLAAGRGFPGFIKAPSILGRKRPVCSAASCSHKPAASEGDPSGNELGTKGGKKSRH